MILNADLTFASLDDIDRAAFVGPTQKMLVPAGTHLYKWTDGPLVGPKGISRWWLFYERTRLPNGIHADGFADFQEYARRLGKSDRDYARVRAAVSGEFKNRMTHVLNIVTRVPAWGFVGTVSGQPEFAKQLTALQHVYFIGGAPQLCLPNLKPSDIREL
jgi:hypothetical protein